jgi:hypothetical protein
MLILLLPITTLCVAILGFYVWHRQLAGKRHSEVADAALSALNRAEAALTYARNPASFINEGRAECGGMLNRQRRARCSIRCSCPWNVWRP